MIDYVLRVSVDPLDFFTANHLNLPIGPKCTGWGLSRRALAEKVVVPGDITKPIAMTAPGIRCCIGKSDPISVRASWQAYLILALPEPWN